MEREFPSSSFLDSDRVPCGSRYRRWIVSLQLPQNISGSTALSGELRVETRTESKVQRVLLQGGKISIYFKKKQLAQSKAGRSFLTSHQSPIWPTKVSHPSGIPEHLNVTCDPLQGWRLKVLTDTRCIKLYIEPCEAENTRVSSHYAREPNVLTVRHQSLYPFYSVTTQAPTSPPASLLPLRRDLS